MADTELAQEKQKNILILCVDRDNDIEIKAAIKTPLLGRATNLDAAVALALKDPEEPDANAMFEAVRLYDQLVSNKKPNENFEVVTISGTEMGGVAADRKLAAELDHILKTYAITEIIFVSDGYTDEEVFPIIETRGVPISSVRRIVIKHSESIEETAAVFTKYLKMLIETPKYSRIALGLPGILVTIFAIFWAANITLGVNMYYYGIAIALVIGAFLLLKGFGVDMAVKNGYKWIREYSPPPVPVQISNYTVIAGILCIVVSLFLGVQYVTVNLPLTQGIIEGISQIPMIIALFIKGTSLIMISGVLMILIGRSLTFYFEKDIKLLRNTVLIAEAIWVYFILVATANLLQQPGILLTFETQFFREFIQAIVVGILIGIAAILLYKVVSKKTIGFFKKDDEEEKQKDVTL